MTRWTASGDSPAWKRTFFTVWGGQAFSILGSYLVQFALVWYVTRTTGSPKVLAAASLAALLPQVILGPFVGALVDRWNRRRVMIAADTFTALVTLGLVLLFWSGALQIWHIYVAMALRSVGSSFHGSAQSASTTLMVPKEHLARIAGLNQMLSGALGVISPPLGALLMEALPVHQVLAVDLITAALAVLPLLFIGIPQPKEVAAHTPATNLIGDVRQGLRFIVRWPGVLAVILLAMLLNLVISPVFSMLPLLVTEHFKGGAMMLGAVDSFWGAGLVAGGLLLSAWGGFKNRVITALMGIVGMGAGVIVLGLTPATAFPLALGSLLAAGIMNSLCNGSFAAIMQENIPPAMQGRVFAVVSSGCMAMMPIGLAIAGPLAEEVGVPAMLVGGGAINLLAGLVAFMIPAILKLESNRPTDFDLPLEPVAAD